MRPRSLLLVATLAGLALLVFLFLRPPVPPQPPVSAPARSGSAEPPTAPPDIATPPPAPSATEAATDQTAPPIRRKAPLRIPAGQAMPELFPNQAERDTIQRLATTFDPARIPEIARYLAHAEPTVRDAARLGLVQIGDAAAIPHLRSARVDTPEERELLDEAIEFLTLANAPASP